MTHLSQTHHKVIVPWYDSGRAIVCSIMGLAIILAFGVVGIIVARETSQYKSLFGMPLCIVLMSGYVIISMVVRVFIRNLSGSK
jgi:ABC-type sulfate transport system permease subunit